MGSPIIVLLKHYLKFSQCRGNHSVNYSETKEDPVMDYAGSSLVAFTVAGKLRAFVQLSRSPYSYQNGLPT